MLVFLHIPLMVILGTPPDTKNGKKWEKFPRRETPQITHPNPFHYGKFFDNILFFCLKNFFLFKVKHVLAPQGDFAKLCKQTEKNGIWSDPPVPFWNFSHFFPFFLTVSLIRIWSADDELITNWWWTSWWWTDDEMMMNWWCTGVELMMSWWWIVDEEMSSWWADDMLMMCWWSSDGDLMVKGWTDDELVSSY